jgi:hypothetical protein
MYRARCASLAVSLAIVVSVQASAQDKPNFSGSWVLLSVSPPATDSPPRAMTVRQVLVDTTMHGQPMQPFYRDMWIGREYESRTLSETYRIGVVGGSFPGINADGSRTGTLRAHHAVVWDDQTLVFESGTYTGELRASGVWSERREVWTLDRDGRLRLVITTRGSDGDARTIELMYRRP